jgi:hypothetical protein
MAIAAAGNPAELDTGSDVDNLVTEASQLGIKLVGHGYYTRLTDMRGHALQGFDTSTARGYREHCHVRSRWHAEFCRRVVGESQQARPLKISSGGIRGVSRTSHSHQDQRAIRATNLQPIVSERG